MFKTPRNQVALRPSRLFLSFLALVGAMVGLACGQGSTSSSAGGSPGIVLITVEAVRPDILAVYGGDVATPNLDRLASLGTVFEDATTVVPMSRPAATAALTGLGPDRSGVRNDTFDRPGNDAVTLAGLFEDDGRATVALVSTPFCSYSSGLDRDFGLFDGPEEIRGGPERYAPPATASSEIARRFSEWLEGIGPEDRFFAWLHLADLQGRVTGEREIEDGIAAYREALGAVDEAVGRILDALDAGGRLEGTAIVLVGTHGQLLGEEEARGAAYWLQDETLSVPLIVKGPGFSSGKRSTARAWLPDVAVTVASLGGVDFGEGSDGADLAGSLPEGRTRRAWTWALDDEVAWPNLTAVDDGKGWQVFDWLQLTSGEAPDGSSSEAFQLARARPATPRAGKLPEDLRKRIEAEGIVTSWEETPAKPLEGSERNTLLAGLQFARHRAAEAQLTRARRRLQLLVDADPDNMAVINERTYVFLRRGKPVAAEEASRRALALYPGRSESLHWAGHVALATGKNEKGELLIEAAMAMTGPDPDLLYDLACTRALAGDADRAFAYLTQAIDTGFRTFSHIEKDPDLASLRLDPRYADLMGSHGR